MTAPVSEIFLSIEGEAMFAGYPTAYIRFAGCNFTCAGFNNPEMVEITNEVLGFDPADYTKLEDIPLITRGCDSIYSWDKRFKHLWKRYDIKELAEVVTSLLPNYSWKSRSGLPIILSLTGGEPTLKQKQIIELLNEPILVSVETVIIETNCSVPLKQTFIDSLNEWEYNGSMRGRHRKIVWSNSPKLSVSGEKREVAINPNIANMQRYVSGHIQYFKFVCGDNDTDFDEVADVMKLYSANDSSANQKVYIMPMACTMEQQQDIAKGVALKCIKRGYIYCHRVHASVFGNTVGT
jgi:organic radical activating enzyme